MKIKIEIKDFITGSVLFQFESENNTIKKTLLKAIASDAYLRDADLRDADLTCSYLRGADLRGAYLRGADLTCSYLRGADLRGAYLRGAYLRGAYLTGADLTGADLTGAYLRDADLTGADLTDAYLRGADFRGADLRGAYLTPIKDDLFALLLYAKSELSNLKKSIIEGKIDGSTYEGECACLCGTIEKTTNENIRKAVYDLRDYSRPIERFCLAIKKGDTPETNQVSKLLLEWVEEFETLIK